MTVLLSFLDELETLQYQSVNRWMYEHGVSRVQTMWQFMRIVYMAHPLDNTTLVEYDARTGNVKAWADEKFDSSECLVVQVDSNTLITFNKRNLSAVKYSNLR